MLNVPVDAQELGVASPNTHPPLEAIIEGELAKKIEHQRVMVWLVTGNPWVAVLIRLLIDDTEGEWATPEVRLVSVD